MSGYLKTIASAAKDVASAVVDATKTVAPAVADAAKTVAPAVADAAKTVGPATVEATKDTVEKINEWSDKTNAQLQNFLHFQSSSEVPDDEPVCEPVLVEHTKAASDEVVHDPDIIDVEPVEEPQD